MNSSFVVGHILGKCRYTKDKRISRHNEIVDLLQKSLVKKHTVLKEPELRHGGQRLKPDLVVKTNMGGVIVLDVTVRYEHRSSLVDGAEEKRRKYSCLLPQFERELGRGQIAEVIPIVVGSRGAIPSITREALQRLGFGKKDRLTISMIALRSSIEMANAFMDE